MLDAPLFASLLRSSTAQLPTQAPGARRRAGQGASCPVATLHASPASAVFGMSKAPGHRFRQGRGHAAHAHPHAAAHLRFSASRRRHAFSGHAIPARHDAQRKTPPPGVPRAPGAAASTSSRSRHLPDAARRGPRARTCPPSGPCLHSMLAIGHPPPAIPAGDGVPHVVEAPRCTGRYLERRRAPHVVERPPGATLFTHRRSIRRCRLQLGALLFGSSQRSRQRTFFSYRLVGRGSGLRSRRWAPRAL